MTGYAAATAQHNGCLVSVTLRSVNHRYLDVRMHFPEFLLPLERKSRALLLERNPRGHVDLKVAVEGPGGEAAAVNEAVLGRYVETFRRIGEQYGIPAPQDLAALAQLPGVVVRGDAASSLELTSELESALLQTIREALERWDAVRAEEAAVLAEDLRARLAGVSQAVVQLERWQQEKLERAKQQLKERLEVLLGQAGLDPARLAQEALLLAERTDASEEILRLKAHVAQFGELLDEDADAGRKLDFLLQEMQREANTLLSKVAGLGEAGLPMTRAGLDMKAEIEKMREQVQNLQ